MTVGAQAVVAADVEPKPIGEHEQIQFLQDKAHANMRELEDRMFAFAELIREAQPEDSARLLLALRKARELLISDKMQNAAELLSALSLDQATVTEKEIIADLEILKQLLLTIDIDLEIRLEQLRQLRTAMTQLLRLIDKETQQKEQTERATNSELDEEKLQRLTKQEKRNEAAGADIKQLALQASPDARRLVNAVSGACGAMGTAGEKLGAGQPGAATSDQEKAIDHLKQARAELEDLQNRLREEVEALAKQKVMEELAEMLAQQRKVREATENLAPQVVEERPQAVVAVRRLSPEEDRITGLAEKSLELLELTGFSLVLPVALSSSRDLMVAVGEALELGRADDHVIRNEKRIEDALEAMLDALKSSVPVSKTAGTGKCKGCSGDRNKLLAELKMLRWMQFSVNGDTAELNDLRQSSPDVESDAVNRASEIGGEQVKVREITGQLHSRTCPACM